MPLNDYKGPRLSRRNALRAGFGVAVAAQLAMIEQVAFTPNRAHVPPCRHEQFRIPGHPVRHR